VTLIELSGGRRRPL